MKQTFVQLLIGSKTHTPVAVKKKNMTRQHSGKLFGGGGRYGHPASFQRVLLKHLQEANFVFTQSPSN